MPAECPVCGAEIDDISASLDDGCPSCNADPRDRFESRLADLEHEVAQLREENRELRDRLNDDESDDRRTSVVCRDDDPEISDLFVAVDGMEIPLGPKVSYHAELIEDVEDSLDELAQDGPGGVPDEARDDLVPIQRIVRTPPEQLSANDRRATFLWRDFPEYSDPTAGGRVISSSDAMRVLSAAEDSGTTIESKTVERVFDRLVDYTRGAASKKKVDGKWRLKVSNDWKHEARAAGDGESDTAVSGGD